MVLLGTKQDVAELASLGRDPLQDNHPRERSFGHRLASGDSVRTGSEADSALPLASGGTSPADTRSQASASSVGETASVESLSGGAG